METRMWKRLDEIEKSFSPHHNCAGFIQRNGESDAECEERIARWKAGEGVDDNGRQYTGREPQILVVKFVDPKGQRWEGLETPDSS